MKWTGRSFLGVLRQPNSIRCLVPILSRLKKVQGKKKRDTAARDAVQAALAETADQEIDYDEGEQASNLLSSKDQDVIF